jgi:hypothetical protein
MSPLEGTQSPDHLTPEAQMAASLEANRSAIAHLPEDGSAVTLEILPGMSLAPDDETHRGMVDHQLRNLLGLEVGHDPRIKIESVLSTEITNQSDRSKKTIGQTVVYDMQVLEDDGVRMTYLAVNSGKKASKEGGLSLTASIEHPEELERRAREERNVGMAGSNPVRKLLGRLRG